MVKSYDLSEDIGKVRLAIGDTDIFATGAGVKPDGDNFSDAELNVYLAMVDRWQEAVAPVLRLLANLYSLQARAIWVDDYKEDSTKIAAELRKQADEWDKKVAQFSDDETLDWSTAIGSLDADEAPMPFGHEQWGLEMEDYH